MLKKFLPFSFALALCGMVIVGCEEDPASSGDESMKAEVNGDSWEANDITVQGDNSLVIEGAKGDGTSIVLTIPADAAVESHDLPSSSGFAASYKADAQTAYVGLEGEITINAISDTEVSGSFEFTGRNLAGTDSVDIDDGTFVAQIN